MRGVSGSLTHTPRSCSPRGAGSFESQASCPLVSSWAATSELPWPRRQQARAQVSEALPHALPRLLPTPPVSRGRRWCCGSGEWGPRAMWLSEAEESREPRAGPCPLLPDSGPGGGRCRRSWLSRTFWRMAFRKHIYIFEEELVFFENGQILKGSAGQSTPPGARAEEKGARWGGGGGVSARGGP